MDFNSQLQEARNRRADAFHKEEIEQKYALPSPSKQNIPPHKIMTMGDLPPFDRISSLARKPNPHDAYELLKKLSEFPPVGTKKNERR